MGTLNPKEAHILSEAKCQLQPQHRIFSFVKLHFCVLRFVLFFKSKSDIIQEIFVCAGLHRVEVSISTSLLGSQVSELASY